MSSCQSLPVPLNSCSVTFRDPATTLPAGRLQADIRIHPKGGLTEICPADDCQDNGRGVSICLRNEDVADCESPPTCTDENGNDRYKNPIRRDSDGCLWVSVERLFADTQTQCTSASAVGGLAPESGGHSFGDATEVTYTNDSCFSMVVRPEICISSALIGAPEPTGSGSVDSSGDTIPCSEIYSCRTDARIVYELNINDGASTVAVFSSSGSYAVHSGSVCLPPQEVAAGDSYTWKIQPQLNYLADARDPFEANSGSLEICLKPEYKIESDAC